MLFQLSQFLNTIWPPNKGGAIFTVLSGSSKGHLLPKGRQARRWGWPQHRLCPHWWDVVTLGMNWNVKTGNKVRPRHQTWQSDEPALGSAQGIQSGAKGDRARDRTGNKATRWVQSSARSQDQRQGMDTTYNVHTRGPSRRQGTYSIMLHANSNGSRSTTSEAMINLTKEQETEQATRRLALQVPSLLPDTPDTNNTPAIHNNYWFSMTPIHFTHPMAIEKLLSSLLTSCTKTEEDNTSTKRMLS